MTEKPWKDMTPDEKRAWRVDRWRNPACRSRLPRRRPTTRPASTAFSRPSNCGCPDRVPICLGLGYWPGRLAGMTPYEVMTRAGPRRAGLDRVQPRVSSPTAWCAPLPGSTPSQMLEALDYRLYSWPGHGVAKEASFQYNEKEMDAGRGVRRADRRSVGLHVPYLSSAHGRGVLRVRRHLFAVRLRRAALRRREHAHVGLAAHDG